ncbi:hypothetical protein F2Q69_00012407 [Brassica cretica]|uniref:Uncharacterized protein n=1 Tax=Brassica cretica TaxID=69181 RepID=A0A8S9R1A6_BRACR|nr:hypothetical protein F2Q69_00012407 [Brassica cretica]
MFPLINHTQWKRIEKSQAGVFRRNSAHGWVSFTVNGWLWLRFLVFSSMKLPALGSGCITFSSVINRLLALVTVAFILETLLAYYRLSFGSGLILASMFFLLPLNPISTCFIQAGIPIKSSSETSLSLECGVSSHDGRVLISHKRNVWF